MRFLPLAFILAAHSVNAAAPANPYLAFLPNGVEPDYKYWNKKLAEKNIHQNQVKLQAFNKFNAPLLVKSDGSNNSLIKAVDLPTFGTDSDKNNYLLFSADQTNGSEKRTKDVDTAEEDNSIVTAQKLPVLTSDSALRVSAEIGDGKYGSNGAEKKGDVDFYELQNVVAKEAIRIEVIAKRPPVSSSLDSQITIFDKDGNRLAVNDDALGSDSLLNFYPPVAGNYYIMVGSYNSNIGDARDETTVSGGTDDEGRYQLVVQKYDYSYFKLNAKAGDVLEVAVTGESVDLGMLDDKGELLISPPTNFAGLMPAVSPVGVLFGNKGFPYVISNDGEYYLRMAFSGAKVKASAVIYRPGLELSELDAQQTIYVDFDGATVNGHLLFDATNKLANLSPLSAFLDKWDIPADKESQLIDEILAVMKFQLDTDLSARGNNPKQKLKLLNSRDHADPFGQKNVSRVIIGGTQEELGLNTIGIAQSIDPGNFDREETGVVLLDALSEAAPENEEDRKFSSSANLYEVEEGIEHKIALVARLVGTIASHEVGHFVSSFHTDQENDQVNIMDQGGKLAQLVGVNDEQKVFAKGRFPLPKFEVDVYVPNEGIAGTEDTLNATAFGLSSYSKPVMPTTPAKPEPQTPTDNKEPTNPVAIAGGGGGSGGALIWLLLLWPLVRRR